MAYPPRLLAATEPAVSPTETGETFDRSLDLTRLSLEDLMTLPVRGPVQRDADPVDAPEPHAKTEILAGVANAAR